MRFHIHRLVSRIPDLKNQYNHVYNLTIMAVAMLSMVPLMFKQRSYWLSVLDLWTVYILFVDYILHWIVADYEHPRLGKKAFYLYPITPLALMSFVSLLPSLGLLHSSMRILRLFRLVIVLRYSKNFLYIANVFKNERKTLLTVLYIALGYIFISALVMFVSDPDTFENFYSAVYWATTALTTVGYGDVYPHNDLGRLVSMVSSLFGIAIIALPAGVVTAGFMQELEKAKNNLQKKEAREERQLEKAREEIARLKDQLSQYDQPSKASDSKEVAPHA